MFASEYIFNVSIIRDKNCIQGVNVLILIDLSRIRKGVLTVLCFLLIVVCTLAELKAAETGTNIPADEIEYKNYSAFDGKIAFKLPAKWSTTLRKFDSNEVLYHNDFISDDKIIHGFVEVWNLNMPLIEFIKQGKENPIGIASYKNYTIEDVRINGMDGYILSYSRAGSEGKYIKAFEVFILDKGNSFYRFSFFMDESKWKNEYRMFFLNIAASLKVT